MATMAGPAPRRRYDRLFYTGMGVLLALLTFWGFYRSYYLNNWLPTPPGFRRMDPLLHLHGAIFTAWIALGVVQPALIAARNPGLHRKLGWVGAATALLMVIFGNLAAVAAMHGGFIGLDPYTFYAVPFFAIWSFAILVALAIHHRNRTETHKRLILLSSTQIVEAAVARVPLAIVGEWAPFSFFIGANIVILAGIAYDLWSRGRVHRVWIWGSLFVVASQIGRGLVAETAAWGQFARFMASLWA